MPKNPAAKEEYSKKEKLHNLGYRLTEAQCRYAMENTTSNAEAAKWLHISYKVWRKYASSYIDESTEVSLFELHKLGGKFNKRVVKRRPRVPDGVERKKGGVLLFQPVPLDDILAGKKPNYPKDRLLQRLIAEGLKEDRCERCGFQEKRASDFMSPNRLRWKNGDESNWSLDNLEVLCWNCTYLTGTLKNSKRKWKIAEDGEIVPENPTRKLPSYQERRTMLSPDFNRLEIYSAEGDIDMETR